MIQIDHISLIIFKNCIVVNFLYQSSFDALYDCSIRASQSVFQRMSKTVVVQLLSFPFRILMPNYMLEWSCYCKPMKLSLRGGLWNLRKPPKYAPVIIFLAVLTKETAKLQKISVRGFVINVVNLYAYSPLHCLKQVH